jgi:hypothetical protein
MAEPIILPLLSSENHVRLPPDPTNPPGPRDITNALCLTNDLLNARSEPPLSFKFMYLLIYVGRNQVTDDDVCNGALYQHKLISVKATHGQ